MQPLAIGTREFSARRQTFSDYLTAQGLKGAVLFSPISIFYLTGFHFIPTERPIALLLTTNDATKLLVPRLEHEHAEAIAHVTTVVSYPEYPGTIHPMQHLVKWMEEAGLTSGAIGMDGDGYASAWGYRGPKLSSLIDAKLTAIGDAIERMRMSKSPAELSLIKESCKWGNVAHTLLQQYSVPGAKEIEIANRASTEATSAMIQTLGRSYRPAGSASAFAGFRGQIGANSAFPHAVTINAALRPGDTLVTGAAADIFGYHSELERTMFVGEPSGEQRRYFDLMLGAQDLSFSLIRPGITCQSVEMEMQRYFKEHDIVHLTRHHTGHNIGLQGHEMPFLDLGDETMIEEGMLFTLEPGIYVEGVGGFRHSDTVVVTEDGIDVLTYYPRDLNSLICR
jgi:Xaa-Pro dipeptidase